MNRMPNRGLAAWQDQFMTAFQQGVSGSDPDLAAIVRLASEIVAIERQPGGALDPRTPSTFKISDLRAPMRAYLIYRRHPLLVYALPIGILALAFVLGRSSASPVKQEVQ